MDDGCFAQWGAVKGARSTDGLALGIDCGGRVKVGLQTTEGLANCYKPVLGDRVKDGLEVSEGLVSAKKGGGLSYSE